MNDLEKNLIEMENQAADINSTNSESREFSFAGKHYTLETFASAYNVDLQQANSVIDVLAAQGKIDFGTEQEIADKTVRNALKEAGIFSAAQAVEEDQENEINHQKQVKRQGRHIYEKVSFDFGSLAAAKDFKVSVKNLRLESDIVVDEDNGGYIVTVYSLSDKELTALSNIYKANKAIKATVDTTNKVFDNALKATDYTAKKVVVPVAKIGLSGALNIGKSLVNTLAKVGSIAVSETVKTTRSTVESIKEDDAVAVAKAELHRTKNEIQHSLNKRSGGGGNGIKIG